DHPLPPSFYPTVDHPAWVQQQLSFVEHVHSGSSNKPEGHPVEQTNKTAPVNCPGPKHTARKAPISGKLSGDYE
ncbi:hypothetical protein Ancab_013808, partial [Ancistrocladus abbreviatus]